MDRDALERNQIPIYFVAVIAAAIGGLMAPSTGQGLELLVTPAIAVLMYAMFLQIPFLNLREGLSHKPFMAALLIANFVFIPLLVWGLTRVLAEHPAILAGALLVLLTPCIDYVVVFTHIGKGDSRLILSATPILLLLQLALLPLYLGIMLSGQSAVVHRGVPGADRCSLAAGCSHRGPIQAHSYRQSLERRLGVVTGTRDGRSAHRGGGFANHARGARYR